MRIQQVINPNWKQFKPRYYTQHSFLLNIKKIFFNQTSNSDIPEAAVILAHISHYNKTLLWTFMARWTCSISACVLIIDVIQWNDQKEKQALMNSC